MFRFNWDVAKYPIETPLKVTATTIQATVSKIEEDLKVIYPLGVRLCRHPIDKLADVCTVLLTAFTFVLQLRKY